MSVADYIRRVESGDWPSDPMFPAHEAETFLNDAGSIANILFDLPIGSVSLIHSVRGSTRSNHYHKTDWHFILVMNGEMLYLYRPLGSKEEPERVWVGQGQLIFTPPLVEHATFFPVATDLVTFNNRRRDKESHEQDVIRLDAPLISGKVCGARPDESMLDVMLSSIGLADHRPSCGEPAEHVGWTNDSGQRWMHMDPHGRMFP